MTAVIFPNIVHCQLCEGKNTPANIMCEQCEVFYCDDCKDNCHPMRGPLAQNPPEGGWKIEHGKMLPQIL